MREPRVLAGRAGLTVSVLAVPGLVLSGCGGGDALPGEPMDVSHVHAIAVDPEDPERVYLATHEGLGAWTTEGVERVSATSGDFMGFAIGPGGVLYGSGHPGRGEDAPFALGLISSDDGGRSWEPVSLSGEADFHALTADADGVLGYDASNGLLRASSDGQDWEDREAASGFLDLAADPASERFLGTTGEGMLVVSDNRGVTFEPVPDAPDLLLVEVFADGSLIGVAPDGTLLLGGADGAWEPTGARASEGLQGLAVGPDDSVWLLDGEGLSRSTDRGTTLERVPGW